MTHAATFYGWRVVTAAFGLVRELWPSAPAFFLAAALIQGLTICVFLAGRRR